VSISPLDLRPTGVTNGSFRNSRRQYIYRLKKWGCQKYKTQRQHRGVGNIEQQRDHHISVQDANPAYSNSQSGQSLWSHGSVRDYPEASTDTTEYAHEVSGLFVHHPPSHKDVLMNFGQYTAETTYSPSETSSLPPARDKEYVFGLAEELFGTIKAFNPDIETLKRISNLLPNLLKAFSLKLGLRAQTQRHRDVSYFVHKHRG
jgi:hypothetical protein